VTRRSWQVSMAEAYTVRCPLCKSKPGFTCTYLPRLINPSRPDLGWHPKSGQPTARPHAERYDQFRKIERERDKRRRLEERQAETNRIRKTWQYSIARSIRDGAMRDQAELVAWLRQHASILTDIEKEDHAEHSGADLTA
jgi:hypothetical protein